jgi:hypothetical protein
MNSGVPDQSPVPTGRLVLGGAIFVVGFLSPLLVPLVARTDLPTAWKTTVSGLLLLGIPELFTIFAAAVLGKAGFEYLKYRIKRAFGRFFREHGPPETVSRRRYRIGLVMFTVPIVLGWMTPYALHHLPGYEKYHLLYGLPGDVLLIASLFVLGGEFWDKLRSLFVHGARAQFPAAGSGS